MGKKIPVWQCLLVMVVMIVALMWSIIVDDGGEPHIALIIAASFAAIIGVANGWKWNYMEQGILASINRSMQAILILAIVGAMICSWLAAGTIPSMMYYGIKVISPKVFLVTACILCSIVSLATGSSWSTAGSMGVALIGVGTALGFPVAMTAGAVVSGAYFGDKMSPLSDTTNLAPAMAGATLFGHIKHMVYTTGTSLVIALVAYAVMGFMHASNNAVDMSVVDEISTFIQGSSKISVLSLLPPIFVIVAVAMKFPAIPSLIGGVFIGVPFFFWNKTAVETATGLPLKNSIFTIMNNGISMGQVPEGTEDGSIISQLASLLSNGGTETVYRADDRFEDIILDKKEVSYSYFGDPLYVWMDDEYNQYEVEAEVMEDVLKYLEDGMKAEVVLYNGRPISIELPTILVREVVYTEPAVKGDTSGKVMKPAKLATGHIVQVPAFVNTGDKIEIDTRTDEYRSRVM